jgi:hypothetical protein
LATISVTQFWLAPTLTMVFKGPAYELRFNDKQEQFEGRAEKKNLLENAPNLALRCD